MTSHLPTKLELGALLALKLYTGMASLSKASSADWDCSRNITSNSLCIHAHPLWLTKNISMAVGFHAGCWIFSWGFKYHSDIPFSRWHDSPFHCSECMHIFRAQPFIKLTWHLYCKAWLVFYRTPSYEDSKKALKGYDRLWLPTFCPLAVTMDHVEVAPFLAVRLISLTIVTSWPYFLGR